jgi:hypothetical protein
MASVERHTATSNKSIATIAIDIVGNLLHVVGSIDVARAAEVGCAA